MSEFTYLFRGGNLPNSPEQAQQRMQQWTSWINGLRASGHLKEAGRPLERTGKVVRTKTGTVTDGPYAEAKDLVNGFMIVDAKDIAHAAELSTGCPILENGGFVEVRPVMEMTLP